MSSSVTVRMSIEPDLCGPFSVGTVSVIKLLRDRLGLTLGQANALVNACVFEEQQVEFEAPSADVARALIEALARTQAGPRIHAVVVAA